MSPLHRHRTSSLPPVLALALAAFLPACAIEEGHAGPSPEAFTELEAPAVLQRVAVIGASASAGFGLDPVEDRTPAQV